MKTFEGKLVSDGIKIGIVAARFNEFITSKLLGGAMDGLIRHDVREEDIHVAWVPGAFEIPLIAAKMAKSGKYDAVICLGPAIMIMCVMRFPRGLLLCRLRAGFRSCLACSRQRTSSRRLSALAQKLETRAMTVQWVRSRW